MRPATFSTEKPPKPILCVETLEYVQSLRRRIEVKQFGMEKLASQVQELLGKVEELNEEVEKLSLDLGIRQGDGGPGWKTVLR